MIRECIHSLAFFSFDTCSLFVLFHSKKVVASCKDSNFDINLNPTLLHMSLTLRSGVSLQIECMAKKSF